MKKSIYKMLAAALVAGGFAFSASAQTNITSNITADATWDAAGSPYILQDIIYVTNGADLTVEAGTTIQGWPDSQDGNSNNNNPGTLVITRGSKIFGNGTADQPIIFTGIADENVPTFVGTPAATWTSSNDQTELCGGVVLLGSTYATVTDASDDDLDGNPEDGGQIEGLTQLNFGRFGGNAADVPSTGDPQTLANDADDSGEMSYWSIRYAGEVIGQSNELNGFTLGAVGSQTDISHIEVINPKDDGVEFFGGTVNTKNVVVVNSGDDSIDWDMGFRGKMQYWFVMQGAMNATKEAGRSDKAGEMDGADKGDQNIPFAVPTLFNGTFIGLGGTAEAPLASGLVGLYIRDGGGGRFGNSYLLNFEGGAVAIENKTAEEEANDNVTVGNSAAHLTQLYSLLPANANFGTSGTNLYTHGNQGMNILDFVNVGVHNSPLNASGQAGAPSSITSTTPSGLTTLVSLPIVSLSQAVSTTDPTIYETTSVDPRAAATGVTHDPSATDAFFDNVNYSGAFAPDSNWAAGWTLVSQIGQMVIPADIQEDISASGFGFSFDSVNGADYLIQFSTDLSSWSSVDSVTATSSSTTYFDPTNLGTRGFYRVLAL
jgi:hypothetical protein